MHKYQVGQRVRRNADAHDYNGSALGTITKVAGVDGYYRVAVDNYKEMMWHEEYFHALPEQPSVANGRALPSDSDTRKLFPLFSGCLAYFPAALAEVSNHSYLGNEKHNPGKPLQHARGKSGDHADCILRHLVDAQEVDGRAKIEELRALAWRALALLQEECERQGTKAAPAATFN